MDLSFNKISDYNSALFIIFSNLMILLSVIFFDVNAAVVILTYWIESGIIGLFTILKIICAKGPNSNTILKIILVPFFMLHYGAFMMGHLFVIIALIFTNILANDSYNVLNLLLSALVMGIILIVSHAYSFYTNYILNEERNNSDEISLMFKPYGRIIIMQITIIFGAGLLIYFKNSKAILILMIVAKTFVDIKSHLKEREYAQNKVPITGIFSALNAARNRFNNSNNK